MSDGHLPSLLRAGGLLVHHVDRDTLRRDEWSPTIHAVTVVDGQDEVDLALALRRLRPLDATLVAPGAPLAMLLEGLAPAVRHEDAVDLAPGQLVVVGSRHPASLAQLRQLLAADACAIGLSPGRALACGGDDERWLDQQAARARTAVAEGRVVVLHTLVEVADLEAYRRAARVAGCEHELPRRVAARMAEVAAGLVARLDPPGITVLGGATCRALCQRLGVVALRAHRAPAPGLALCTARDADGRRLAPRRILEVIQLTREALGGAPRIAVAGLNPHAGEDGAFGDEETRAIAPAIAAARAAGIDVSGPHPPDTVFMHAFNGRYDAVVAMYHDQGHIPMKAGGIADTVNVTIGLPVIRTSVDHGTAFDIAYRGVADPTNFTAACRHAQRLAQRRGVPA